MTHEMHGTFGSGPGGGTLSVVRDLAIDVDEAWRWITESERTAQWYGPWEGDGRPGGVVTVTMLSEEGAPETPMTVTTCEAPRLLGLTSSAPPPWDWPLELECLPRDNGSTVVLRHLRLVEELPLRDIGPGWEFYLDRLVAAVEGREPAPFEDLMTDLADRYAALR